MPTVNFFEVVRIVKEVAVAGADRYFKTEHNLHHDQNRNRLIRNLLTKECEIALCDAGYDYSQSLILITNHVRQAMYLRGYATTPVDADELEMGGV